jgi:ATP-dependent helicase HrpB
MDSIPIQEVMADLQAALRAGPRAVLVAPPGSGKTTRVPLALLAEPWLEGRKIIVLEPRRLAARMAARYMAGLRAEPVGATVGYRVRLDTRVGPATRVEVVTEGVLTRMLQSDPGLSGVGLVIFDEFHERHLESDLGLALCLEVQAAFNPGLRLLVMSATLDAAPVAALLGGAPVIAGAGRRFEVAVRHLAPAPDAPVERTAADAVRTALAAEGGNVLVFLPGAPEIRRTLDRLARADLGPNVMLAPLFGDLGREEQDRAVAPPPAGRRKIVLATAIAQTGLTIEGVRIVVDGGLMRLPRFDPGSGMTRLVTVPVARDAADQRAGRAGRDEPGVCYRLWSAEADRRLAERTPPEILQADLAALALELALWGVDDPSRLAWMDRPPEAAFRQARRLLRDLGALDAAGRPTARGRRMAELPLHPRLAHMLLAAAESGLGAEACDLAAILGERDFMKFPPGGHDSDLALRVEALADLRAGRSRRLVDAAVDRHACRRCLRVAERLRRLIGGGARPADGGGRETGRLLAWAYPERVGRRRAGEGGRFLLANGRGAYFADPEPLAAADFVVAADLDGERQEARIFRAAAIEKAALRDQFGERLERREVVAWDPAREAVAAARELRLGAILLESEPIARPDPQAAAAALVEGIRRSGIGCLPWTAELRGWQARVEFLRRERAGGGDWPDLTDEALAATLEEWLGPHLAGLRRIAQLSGAALGRALAARLTPRQKRLLEELAPTHLRVPSGARIRLDYSGEVPVLAVRLQEMFGCAETPRVAGGRRPVRLHLLSPAGRPVQITSDLAGFWDGSYREVRRALRGRYPKHAWPEDPRQKKRGGKAPPA